MSHLIIEVGENVGTEILIPESGMKFGRSPANDIVLGDESVMLFHGRFFFKSDGSLWVTDFGAGEKIRVGDQPVDEHLLKVGDLVSVGQSAFRVINTQVGSGSETAQPVAAEPSGIEPIDLGFKRSGRAPEREKERPAEPTSGGSKLTHRLSLVATAFLTLVVIFLVFMSVVKIVNKGGRKEQKEMLVISYERVKGDSSNISRYYLELDANRNLSLWVKDLKNNRNFRRRAKLDPGAVQELSNKLAGTRFLELESGQRGEESGYDLYDVAVQRNGVVRHIKVLNCTMAPAAVRAVEKELEAFAQRNLDIPPTWFKDNDELMMLARKAYEVGEQKYQARDVHNANLASAISLFKEVTLYLETFAPRPELYRTAALKLEEAKAEQDRRYEESMFNADQAMRLRDWEEAQKILLRLMDLVPDRNDERFIDVNEKLLIVDQQLR